MLVLVLVLVPMLVPMLVLVPVLVRLRPYHSSSGCETQGQGTRYFWYGT